MDLASTTLSYLPGDEFCERAVGRDHRVCPLWPITWTSPPRCDQDDGATLDDLREAVATLESVAPLWKRVFGPSHPETPLVQNALEDAREALAANETPSPRT